MRTEADIKESWSNQEPPLVSITCTAYNHEAYIEKAIEGFLMQQTTFPFEIILHDDASTDKTPDIIRHYAQRYPTLIRPILQKENQWMGKGINATAAEVWPAARGRYIAWCEGDDYWTDPLKLQKQVGFLEAHPDYNLCFHPVHILQGNRLVADWITRPPATDMNILDFARYGNFIHTPSVVMRNNFLPMPEWMHRIAFGDFPTYMLCLQDGKAHMLPDYMAVYRYGSGLHSTQARIKKYQGAIHTFQLLADHFDGQVRHILLDRIHRLKASITLRTLLWSPAEAYKLMQTYWHDLPSFLISLLKILAGKLFRNFHPG